MMWDVELLDGVIFAIILITPFVIITIIGIALTSAIIASNKKLSNIPAYILGALVGIALMTIGNAIIIYFGVMHFEFTSLPSIVTIILLTYVGSKMNVQANSEAETKSTKLMMRTVLLRAVLWIALFACAGSVVYELNETNGQKYGAS